MDYKARAIELIRWKKLELDGTEFVPVLDDLERQISEFPDRAQKVKKYTPILKGSPISYPVWRCTNCGHEERTVKGFYCRMCGRRFTE